MKSIKELKIQLRLAWLNLFTEVITIGPMGDIPIYYAARNNFHEVYANSKVSKKDAKIAVKEQMERIIRLQRAGV